jgi:hypothetical protein
VLLFVTAIAQLIARHGEDSVETKNHPQTSASCLFDEAAVFTRLPIVVADKLMDVASADAETGRETRNSLFGWQRHDYWKMEPPHDCGV